jgi:hypothetical protein
MPDCADGHCARRALRTSNNGTNWRELIMRRRFFVVFSLAWMALAANSQSQELALLDLYGQGVHAYFSGDTDTSLRNFNAAVAGGSRDPRVFYFRGLAYQRVGWESQAEADFRQGGMLEASDADRYYDVSRALERIQGSGRMALERYRAQGRVAAIRRAQEQQLLRYQQMRSAEPGVTIPVGPPPELPEEESETEMPIGAAPQTPVAPKTEEAPEEMTEEPAAEAPQEAPAELPKATPAEEPDPFAEPAAPEAPAAPSRPATPEAPPAEAPQNEPPAEAPPAEAAPAEGGPEMEAPAAAPPATPEAPAEPATTAPAEPPSEEPAADTPPAEEPPQDAPSEAPSSN